MTDLFLNISMPLAIFINQLLTMGLPLIDESLAKLLEAMQEAPTGAIQSIIVGWARTIGSCLALGVGSYEAWMMILGRRGMDVIKMLRIAIIAFCLTNVGMRSIKTMVNAPGRALAAASHSQAISANKQVAEKEKQVAKMQKAYIDSLRSKQAKLAEQKAAQDAVDESQAAQEAGGGISGAINRGIEWVKNGLENLKTSFVDQVKQVTAMAETKTAELINDVIRFIGEVIFQMTYYGMLLGQTIFMNILWMFMPIAFAMSLAPPFRNAWSQWLSKYLSLSLWPFVIYLILYYVDYLLQFYLQEDFEAYKGLMNDKNINTWGSIGALGVQAIGTTCMYVVGLLAGARILAFVPEVCSWLIPGGVSSGAGQASAGVAAAAGGYAGSVAGNTAGAVGGVVVGAPAAAAKGGLAVVGGMVANSAQTSESPGKSFAKSVLSQTSYGQAYANGGNNVTSVNNVGKEAKDRSNT
jgi:hypothetical protein